MPEAVKQAKEPDLITEGKANYNITMKIKRRVIQYRNGAWIEGDIEELLRQVEIGAEARTLRQAASSLRLNIEADTDLVNNMTQLWLMVVEWKQRANDLDNLLEDER